MKIIYKQGNLLDCEEPIVVHGVNCQLLTQEVIFGYY